jgi:hypothetical protein
VPIEKTICVSRSEFEHYSELVRLKIPDCNVPEFHVLGTYPLADVETILGPDVSILFHVYNAPDCICFEYEFVFADTNHEINSSPIYLSLLDTWIVVIDQKEYKFSVKAGN